MSLKNGVVTMKAWVVREKEKFYTVVVFAETAGKAKSIAMNSDGFEYSDFCDIEAQRVPQMDKYYKEGKVEMDWYDPQDRVALVKDCNFICEYIEMSECETCPAREFCSEWEDMEG